MATKNENGAILFESATDRRERVLFPFKKAFYYSLAFHFVAFLFFVVTTTETKVVKEQRVRLMLKRSYVGKEITQDDPKQSAPNKKSDDGNLFDESFLKRVNKRNNERSSFNTEPHANKKLNRRKTDNFFRDDFNRRKTANSRDSRFKPDIKHNISRNRDRPADNKNQRGGLTSRGRDHLPGKSVTNPRKGDGSLKRNGNRGSGVQGHVNLRGRRVVYRPRIMLPARYSQMGLRFTVRVKVVVNSDGIVVNAFPVGTTGQIELERILVQNARRFRFERVSGSGSQSGTIIFYIRPR